MFISLEPGGSRPPTPIEAAWARAALGLTAQPARATEGDWLSHVVLEDGQLGIETDTGRVKIGDGETSWDMLAYAVDSSMGADAHYVHEQMSPSTVWTVHHNLNKKPSVQVYDSAGDSVIGDIEFLSLNTLTITFSAAIAGEVVLN